MAAFAAASAPVRFSPWFISGSERGSRSARLSPGRLGRGFFLEDADRVARDLVEAFAAGGKMGDYLAAHPRLPEASQMGGGRLDRAGALRIRGPEEIRDLIGHRDQVMNVHRAKRRRG